MSKRKLDFETEGVLYKLTSFMAKIVWQEGIIAQVRANLSLSHSNHLLTRESRHACLLDKVRVECNGCFPSLTMYVCLV